MATQNKNNTIPRDKNDDYSVEIIEQRRSFVEKVTQVKMVHSSSFKFDPHVIKGNCENFTGVTQVPFGLAGPIKIEGEHAKGDFLVPLATTEGRGACPRSSRASSSIGLPGCRPRR